MYVLYSLLIVVFGVIASPYLAYQAIRYKKYIGSLGQRMGYGEAEVTDGQGRLLARATATFIVLPAPGAF